MISVSSRN